MKVYESIFLSIMCFNLEVMSIKVAASTLRWKSSFNKLSNVSDLVLPIHELQMNVVSQLVYHILSYLILTNYSYFLLSKLVNSPLYSVKSLS